MRGTCHTLACRQFMTGPLVLCQDMLRQMGVCVPGRITPAGPKQPHMTTVGSSSEALCWEPPWRDLLAGARVTPPPFARSPLPPVVLALLLLLSARMPPSSSPAFKSPS